MDVEYLYLYLVVSNYAVSATLIQKDSRDQKPLYYVSKALLKPETRYPQMENPILTLTTTATKLQSYCQSFKLVYMTEHPIRSCTI